MLRSAKNMLQTNEQKPGRTVGKMAKAKLYRQNHKKHTHTHSQEVKKEEKLYIYKINKGREQPYH